MDLGFLRLSESRFLSHWVKTRDRGLWHTSGSWWAWKTNLRAGFKLCPNQAFPLCCEERENSFNKDHWKNRNVDSKITFYILLEPCYFPPCCKITKLKNWSESLTAAMDTWLWQWYVSFLMNKQYKYICYLQVCCFIYQGYTEQTALNR